MNTTAAAETYKDVQHLIYQVIHSYQKRHGGDWDDLLSECHEAFCDAYMHWQQDIGVMFTTYLYAVLWKRMAKAMASNRRMISPPVPIDECDIPDPRANKSNWLGEFMAGISDDARLVVSLALDLPAELALTAERRGGSGSNIRTTIMDALCDDGWSRQSVLRTMREIKAALSEADG